MRPLHGVTGATRRREGAWPPSGSTEPSSVRLRIPTPPPSHKSHTLRAELPYQFIAVYADGIRTGVLKGVCPLHGVTAGATRRREGAWPPSGSTEASLRATSNSHPLLHNVTRRTPEHGAIISVHCRLCGWDSNGGSEGGVPPSRGDGATRRREGAWPPSGSPEVFSWATSNSHPLRQTSNAVHLSAQTPQQFIAVMKKGC